MEFYLEAVEAELEPAVQRIGKENILMIRLDIVGNDSLDARRLHSIFFILLDRSDSTIGFIPD